VCNADVPHIDLGTEGFANGERYHSARPDYPRDAVAFLVSSLKISDDSHVVDLGAGTGILTKQLTTFGARITAVEPTAGMRAVLTARRLPGVTVVDGRDTAIPLPAASADALTVAQAFHWFDAPAALAEIHRVLKPRGGLGLIWNERDESVDWVAELGAAMRWPEFQPYEVGMDFSPVLAAGPFVNIERRRFRHEQVLDRHGLTDRVLTTSYITTMGEADRAALMADVTAVVSRLPEPIVLPYVTDTYRATAAA